MTNEVDEKSISEWRRSSSIAGWSKSISKLTLKPSNGSNRALFITVTDLDRPFDANEPPRDIFFLDTR
jgi:hypothetical protein